ncbi:MAG TPA: ABC transporter ATP-binding protein [Clostridiales bacterium]|nr:MAG: hypothetical protein A2Y18_08460 [Clostridiales bacterium GWD2_32_19]HCC07895.1 ABC transporter ATP-binding protein [Clostridiales bacterium]
MDKKKAKEDKNLTAKESIYYFKRLWSYIRKYKVRVFIYIAIMIAYFAMDLLMPILWGKAIVRLVERNLSEFVLFLSLYIVTWYIDLMLMIINNFLSSRVHGEVVEDLRNDLYRKIVDLPVEAFDKIKSGEIINRVSESTNTVISVVSNLVRVGIRAIREIAVIIIVFFICPEIAYMYLVMIVVVYFVFKKYGRKIKVITKSMRKNSDRYVSNLQQTIQGIRDVKSLGLKERNLLKFGSIVRIIKKKEFKENDLRVVFGAILSSLKMLLLGTVLFVTGYFVYIGRLLADYFFAITSYTQMIIETVNLISDVGVDMQRVSVALERIFEIIDNKLYPDEKFGDKRVEKVDGVIEFKNISFSYNKDGEVLENVNIHIEKNKKTAIVGRSGSGKSTLFSLLLRFYDYKDGEILIDGTNIREFDEQSLRKHISVIRQEPFLFNTTIKENLIIVKQGATLDQIREACKIAFIDEYIMSLPKKYDTLIGEGGVNLSGGQKQRIAIARAMLKKSKIMLFDEATSALDNESQYNVKKAIEEVSKEHTVIIIAHRLSTVIDCDEMILLNNGKVVARGTHEELIKHNEVYNKLYNVDLING